MKIKGQDIDYILLFAYGIGLIWCIYAFFFISEVSLYARVIILLLFALYFTSFKKRIRQIQSSTPSPSPDSDQPPGENRK